MTIAVYGKSFSDRLYAFYETLFNELAAQGVSLMVHRDLWVFISDKFGLGKGTTVFSEHSEIKGRADVLFSIGGDGTFLNTIRLVRDSGIPVLGFNTGRLGFLASIRPEEVCGAIRAVCRGEFQLDKRSLLCIDTPGNIFGNDNFALNEITIHRKDSASMMNIHTYVDGQFLNTYWADGLIVATPTGSTAYSLSCGGPILTPNAENIILTPIAIHNLTVRPIVIPDSACIKLRIEGRARYYLATLDSDSVSIDSSEELSIRKAPFAISLLQLKHKNFFSTIRDKLMWGIDKRNE